MNIGDRVKVELEFKINQLEQHIGGEEIIVSGFVKLPSEHNVLCRVPLAFCKIIQPGVETVMRDAYAK